MGVGGAEEVVTQVGQGVTPGQDARQPLLNSRLARLARLSTRLMYLTRVSRRWVNEAKRPALGGGGRMGSPCRVPGGEMAVATRDVKATQASLRSGIEFSVNKSIELIFPTKGRRKSRVVAGFMDMA